MNKNIRHTLSVVISAYNEESRIADCLNSVRWVDEIIVVDNQSTDNTAEIARKYTKLVFTRPNNAMLNVNKNYGFGKASKDWILSLDADEKVTLELRNEIQKVLERESTPDGYWIPRKNIIFGKWIQSEMWWPDYHLRLFRRGKGSFPEKHVHEHLVVTGETGILQHPLTHDNYQSISQYIYKMDALYTESEVENILAKKQDFNWLDAVRLPINDFLKTFFAQKGYKDGLHGLVLSILQAFYSFIVFAKVWEQRGFKEEHPKRFLKTLEEECKKLALAVRYWFLTAAIQEGKNTLQKLRYKVIRKSIERKL